MKLYMKSILSLILACAFVQAATAQWKPVEGQIMTDWAKKIDVENVLPEYPRPLLERPDWLNLNGLWDYSITAIDKDYSKPDGKILVPFAVESSLSGVGRTFTKDDALWYEREFEIPEKWAGKKILLHFGAVDWKCEVWVNGVKVGGHVGGHAPFSFDISKALKEGGKNTIRVRVEDPTDYGVQPRGKQVMKPYGCFYTAMSGIWQTVWLEPVPETYIKKIRTTPDFDRSRFAFEVEACGADKFVVDVFDGADKVASAEAKPGESAVAVLANPKAWSPASPFIYDVSVSLFKDGKKIDEAKSYAALRKISVVTEKNERKRDAFKRIYLNNEPFYSFGLLDQGWWPDGLYTAPTDEALKFDIQKTKDWGFNTIRKHIKVEPARWYMHCDRLGIFVWQDMPSGSNLPDHPGRKSYSEDKWIFTTFMSVSDKDWACEERKKLHMAEWKEIMDELYSYPCIGVWVPFNERWGQFDTVNVVKWTKQYDPTRLVNAASGGNFYVDCGDILDSHNYPNPIVNVFIRKMVNVIGEYGGIGYRIPENSWKMDKAWGYVEFKNPGEVLNRYAEYVEDLKSLIKFGVSAAIYTQTTDVEGEINGIMTYDRKVVKFNEKQLKEINQSLINSLK